MREQQLPDTVMVRQKNGVRCRYRLTVFLVNTKENGSPRLCTRIPDDGAIDLAGGEEFFTAYIPEEMVK